MMRDLRIAHIADTHLGYRSTTLSGRDQDFARSWIQACRAIVDSRPDMVIHAGDIFHRNQPSWGAVFTFLEGARILKELDVPILMISGNHDSSRLAMQHTVFSVLPQIIPGITIVHDHSPIVQHIPELETQVVLLSHPALTVPGLKLNLEDAVEELSEDQYRILVSHGSVGDLDEHNELGTVVIPDFVFNYPWDYVALGHLHVQQPYGPRGWYSGSIERCGWSDYSANPAWTMTTLSRTKPFHHVQHPLPHLLMLQLPNIDCADVSDYTVVEEIMASMGRARFTNEPAVVRVVLESVTSKIHHIIRRAATARCKEKYPSVILQVDVKKVQTFLPKKEKGSITGIMLSIEEMFKEFVQTRTYLDPGMKELMMEKGGAALGKAQDGVFAGDTGDERTAPTG